MPSASSALSAMAISVPASGIPLGTNTRPSMLLLLRQSLNAGGTAIGWPRAAGRAGRSRSARSGARARCRRRWCRRPTRATRCRTSGAPRAACRRDRAPAPSRHRRCPSAGARRRRCGRAASGPGRRARGSARRPPRRGSTKCRRTPCRAKSSSSPPRNSSWPKRRREGSRGSNAKIGRARISTLTGGSATRGLVGSASAETAASASAPASGCHQPARRNQASPCGTSGGGGRRLADPRRPACSRVQPPPHAARRLGRGTFLEQLGELLGHRAAELLGIHDGDGAAVVARHVVADADGDQLDRRAGLDVLDDPAQVPLEVVAGVDRQRRSRRPARRRRSSSGSCGSRSGRAGACAPSPAPRRRCSP